MTPYVIFRLVLAVLAGAVLFILDRKMGERPYRWWYAMTHELPLQPGARMGFVLGQPTRKRALLALLVATAGTALAVSTAHANALAELLIWAGSIPAVVLGFLLGPSVNRLWMRRTDVFDTVDRIERGDIKLQEELKTQSVGIASRIRNLFGFLSKTRAATPPPDQECEKQPEPRQIEQEPKTTPDQVTEQQGRDLMNKYIAGRDDRDVQ